MESMCFNQHVQKQKTLAFALRGLIAMGSYFLFAFSFELHVSGVKSPCSRIFPGSLVCSLDDCNLFAIVLILFQQSCRDSWKIFYLSCCIFSWLRSSLWLQFKPHHIAAGAAYLAAKFLNLDLSSYQNIWQEFQTTPAIVQDVSQQLMELF